MGFVLSARIGVHQHERLANQRVRINLELTCTEHPAINDDLDNVVNYAETGSKHRPFAAGELTSKVRELLDEKS